MQESIQAGSKWFLVKLSPGAGIRLHMMMNRYNNQPTYETPWGDPKDTFTLIRGRKK